MAPNPGPVTNPTHSDKWVSPKEATDLFRALEWAGPDYICLVCKNQRRELPTNNGHESWCIYAEVFYK